MRRHPRIEIHAAPLDLKMVVGDAKLSGRLVEDESDCTEEGSAFVLDVTSASVVRVDGDELEFTTWSPTAGLGVRRRR